MKKNILSLLVISVFLVGCSVTQEIEEIEVTSSSSPELQMLADAGVKGVRDLTRQEFEQYVDAREGLAAGEMQQQTQSRVAQGAASGAVIGAITGVGIADMAAVSAIGGRAPNQSFSFEGEFKEKVLFLLDSDTSKNDLLEAVHSFFHEQEALLVEAGFSLDEEFSGGDFDMFGETGKYYSNELSGNGFKSLAIRYSKYDEPRKDIVHLRIGIVGRQERTSLFDLQNIAYYKEIMSNLPGDNYVYLSPSSAYNRLPLVIDTHGEITYLVEQ